MCTTRFTKFVRFWLCCVASGHYLWLEESFFLHYQAAITFGEVAGEPGPDFFLEMIADKVSLSAYTKKGQNNLSLSVKGSPEKSELLGHFMGKPPFALRLSATYGLWSNNSLLQYWSSADVVTKPNDWFDIQDWVPPIGLEVTIRDPWMNQSNDLTERIRNAFLADGDECVEHAGPLHDGAACVVGVIRFNGALLDASVSVETFTPSGAYLNKTVCTDGVVILKVPLHGMSSPTPVWARVNYREVAPGKYQGKDYNYVDHWATTYSRIERADSVGIMV